MEPIWLHATLGHAHSQTAVSMTQHRTLQKWFSSDLFEQRAATAAANSCRGWQLLSNFRMLAAEHVLAHQCHCHAVLQSLLLGMFRPTLALPQPASGPPMHPSLTAWSDACGASLGLRSRPIQGCRMEKGPQRELCAVSS